MKARAQLDLFQQTVRLNNLLLAEQATINRPRRGRRPQKVHENSVDARAQELPKLAKRAAQILELFERRRGLHLTDRQIMKWLGHTDMNAVRPRITELIDAGLLKEWGGQRDDATGKVVRIVGLP